MIPLDHWSRYCALHDMVSCDVCAVCKFPNADDRSADPSPSSPAEVSSPATPTAAGVGAISLDVRASFDVTDGVVTEQRLDLSTEAVELLARVAAMQGVTVDEVIERTLDEAELGGEGGEQ